jgi:hypothetical protein
MAQLAKTTDVIAKSVRSIDRSSGMEVEHADPNVFCGAMKHQATFW